MSGTNDRTTSAILGLKKDLKEARAKSRDLFAQNLRWRAVAQSLRKIAGIDDEKFNNLLRAESLTE